MRLTGIWIVAVILANCGQPAHQPAAKETGRAPTASVAPVPPEAPAQPKAPLAEPKGPIDPKSVEAAGQVVQSYGALIEQKRFAEAENLWGDPGIAKQFTTELTRYPAAHLEIGKLGELEGAAGSIFVNEPVTFYGEQVGGQPFRRPANVVLRRVNDVSGSTMAQRRWHIERIDWKAS